MGGRAVLSASTSTVSFSRSSLRVNAKGKSQNRKVPGKAGPSSQFRLPPLDPNNPQFMIYVRSKAVPMWYPVSVITGGSTAKNLVNVRRPPRVALWNLTHRSRVNSGQRFNGGSDGLR